MRVATTLGLSIILASYLTPASPLLRSSYAAVQPLELLFDPLPNFSDEVLDPKFQLSVSKSTPQQSGRKPPESSETLRVQNSEGQLFTCYLPDWQEASSESESQEAEEQALPSALLQDLSDNCLLRLEDWWSYEICFGSQVRQFHKDGNQVTAEFVLGQFSGNSSQVDEVLHEDGPMTLASPYVREVYTNGTSCDVAERQRSVEIRYMCSEDRQTSIAAIKEIHSCAYQITVATPLICSHRAFRGKEVPVQDIHCYPDLELPGRSKATEASTAPTNKEESDATAGERTIEALPAQEAGSSERQTLSTPLEDLDLAAVEDLVTHLIQMGSSEDPDADFMEDSDDGEEDQQPHQVGAEENFEL